MAVSGILIWDCECSAKCHSIAVPSTILTLLLRAHYPIKTQSKNRSPSPCKPDPRKFRDVFFPGSGIAHFESGQTRVPAGTGKDLYQFQGVQLKLRGNFNEPTPRRFSQGVASLVNRLFGVGIHSMFNQQADNGGLYSLPFFKRKLRITAFSSVRQ
jgi:hypothetical protein